MKGHKFSLDCRKELDEMFIQDAMVHIERMNETGFWIGIDSPGMPRLHINTGCHEDTWFFNIEEDRIGGRFLTVERRASLQVRTGKEKARNRQSGTGRKW